MLLLGWVNGSSYGTSNRTVVGRGGAKKQYQQPVSHHAPNFRSKAMIHMAVFVSQKGSLVL